MVLTGEAGSGKSELAKEIPRSAELFNARLIRSVSKKGVVHSTVREVRPSPSLLFVLTRGRYCDYSRRRGCAMSFPKVILCCALLFATRAGLSDCCRQC
jgi:hypothetical protein